jgi:hypothetical protein
MMVYRILLSCCVKRISVHGQGIGRIVHSTQRGGMVKVKHTGIIVVSDVHTDRGMGDAKNTGVYASTTRIKV